MANISKAFQDLMNITNFSLDAKKAIESWNSNDRWSPDSLTNYKNWAASILNNAGSGPALLSAGESFGIDVAKFSDNQTPELFINMVQSFGGLVEATGDAMGGPVGGRVALAGIVIAFYGNTLEAAYTFSSNNPVDVYGWWQSITQTDAKREAEIYAAGLARSLDPAFADATAKVFIDGSKSHDLGIEESVEYIKNIRQLLGLGTEFTAATANDVFSAVQESNVAIHTLYGTSKFQISGVSNARNDLSAFLSLYYLIPFSIKPTDAGAMDKLYQLHAAIADQWNDDRNLTPEQIANGEANFSEQYLADRAAMLGWVSKSNLDDTAGRADGLEAIYEDKASGINLSPLIVSNTPKFVFGASDADAIAGSNQADHLYGGGGDDSINAGDGNDYLEGNTGGDTLNGEKGNDTLLGGAGNDTLKGGEGNDQLIGGAGNDSLDGGDNNDQLKGGAGNDTLKGGKGTDFLTGGEGTDTFEHNVGDGNDVITDTDGVIIANGVELDGGKKLHEQDSYWESIDKQTHYTLFINADGSQTLNILLTNGEKLFVKDWQSGRFGITLDDAEQATPTTPSPVTSQDDYKKVFGGAVDGQGGNDVLVGSVAEETLLGFDIILGQASNDVLVGGVLQKQAANDNEWRLTA